ncbi:MAG: D-alanine--D-alanine ligase [Bacteroidales bacterium]|jgi:D-alanine-D-alanine ligase|nr:D-alanine--D-alanine ligase [Bacteroidales bacterium]
MTIKKNIAVLCGGYTSERQISINSAKQIIENIDKNLFNSYLVEVSHEGFYIIFTNEKLKVNLNDFSFESNCEKIKFDYAFIIIHGSPGEDGKIQGYFDIINIPYSSCNVLASAITYNKLACKFFLSNNKNITMAKMIVINKDSCFSIENLVETIGLPCFIKPNTSGSSYGITKVYDKEKIIEAINEARKEDNTVLIEEFINGVEVSCGIVKTKTQTYIFPITEISTKNDFFDTQAKYEDGFTEEITPARISEQTTKLVQETTLKIYDELNCEGIVRVDYIIKNEVPYFLEINSIPGMSAASIVPKQIRVAGKNISEILTEIIQEKL